MSSNTNFVQLKLALAATAAQTTLTVMVPSAPFQLPAINGTLTLLDVPAAPTKAEIVGYTTVTNNGDGTATLGGVTRGKEGTTAQAWAANSFLFQSLTAADYAADLAAKQDSIAAGTAAQFWRGDKTWVDLGNTVRALVLTGIVLTTNAAITASDTILTALGKLQKQITDLGSSKLDASSFTFANLGSKPTTLSGYGITDAAAAGHTHNYWVPDTAIGGWYRSTGGAGWYSQTYGGGIHMTDSTYVRVYGGKAFACSGNEIVLEGGSPTIRLQDTDWGLPMYVHHNGGSIGFLTSGGSWAFRVNNDGDAFIPWRLYFGNDRGLLRHEIDGDGNRFVKLENWDGGSVHVIHAPGSFVAFGPGGDGNHHCGWGYARWANIWSVNGAIQTSDAREKTAVRPFTPNELAAAQQIAAEIGVYQWLEAVEKKGAGARLHPGQTVQRVMAIMESHNLDPFAYGFVCYDEWEAVPPVYEDDGVTVKVEGREAGNRYSMRYDELAMFIARGQAERQNELEARIAALEVRV